MIDQLKVLRHYTITLFYSFTHYFFIEKSNTYEKKAVKELNLKIYDYLSTSREFSGDCRDACFSNSLM